MLHYHIIVHGKVQGVGFRFYAMKSALMYGINGWVKNRTDGTVEIDAEGSEPNLAEFIESIKHGNEHAIVESVDVDVLSDRKHYESFTIIGW